MMTLWRLRSISGEADPADELPSAAGSALGPETIVQGQLDALRCAWGAGIVLG